MGVNDLCKYFEALNFVCSMSVMREPVQNLRPMRRTRILKFLCDLR